MPKMKSFLRESTFVESASDEPHAITAHGDCIQLHFGDVGAEQIVTLRPDHIRSIVHMHADWWDRFWGPIAEEQ